MPQNSTMKCPVMHGSQTTLRGAGTANIDWWPNQLNIGIVHQHYPASNPLGEALSIDFKG